MEESNVLLEVKNRFVSRLRSWCEKEGCSFENLDDEVVASRPLSSQEAIGNPERDDFPLLRGKEVLMQAVYKGSAGQAFTSASGRFTGSLTNILEMPLNNAFEQALLISTINAVLRSLDIVKGTVHCKDQGPFECASCLRDWLRDEDVKSVGLVGMQPALLEALVETLGPENVMVSDLKDAGQIKCGLKVLDGMDSKPMFESCQLILVTGTCLANGTIDSLLKLIEEQRRRAIFYGTTIAGAAYLMGWERWCVSSA